MTETPSATFVDMKASFADARADADTNQRIVDEFPRQMRRIATKAGAQAGRRQGRIFGVVGLVVALVVSFIAGGLSVDNRAQLSVLQQGQVQTDDALTKLAEQNRILESRGQQPVATPPPSADPADAVAALVLSRVIAQLPPTPTAAQVAAQITPAVTANVLGPTQSQLGSLVADYFRRNPPQPGPAPSQEAIQAAVDRNLNGRDLTGKPGADGKSPPCLSTPAMCQGADGKDGVDGKDGQPGADSTVPGPAGGAGPAGADGPACPAGTHLEAVTYLSGQAGQGCVNDT